MLIVMLSTFGIGSSIARYNFDKLNIKRLYSLGYATTFLSVPFSVLLLILLSFKYDIDMVISFIFVGMVFFSIFNSYTRVYFTINKKIREFSIVKVFELSVFFITVILLDYFGHLNLYTLLMAMFMMMITNTVFSYYYAKDIINLSYRKSFFQSFKKVKRFSIDSYFNGIVKYLNSNLEKFFFVFFLSTTQFGIYALAMTIGSIIRTSGTALFLSFAPVYYENHKHEKANKNIQIYKILFLIAPVLFVLFLYIVKFAWNYIVDSAYDEAYQYVSVIAFLYILEIYYGLAQYHYFQIKNTKFLLNFEVVFFCIYIFTLAIVYFFTNLDLTTILYLLVCVSFIKLLVLILKDKSHDMYKILWLIVTNAVALFFISQLIK